MRELKNGIANKTHAMKIGSFRSESSICQYLPPDLYDAIFQPIVDGLEVTELITTHDDKNAYLNNAAFGRPYDQILKLAGDLRNYAETHSDIFYDQLCLPLIDHTYAVAKNFFDVEHVLLVPNCTFGMKSVVDALIEDKRMASVATLEPLYGATKKLLKAFHNDGHITNLMEINTGTDSWFWEDAEDIVNTLKTKYAECAFQVLFCDETASQSGRILPIYQVLKFCQKHDIRLVVDGTQSCHLLATEVSRRVLKDIDYFVMSTHKWLGNVKTCGVVLFKDLQCAPKPPVVSFGHHEDADTYAKVKDSFRWLGMLDSYISYMTLSLAIKLFSKYGRSQLEYANHLLTDSIRNVLGCVPALSSKLARSIQCVQLECIKTAPMKSVEEMQKLFQNYGVFVSVKILGQGCSKTSTKKEIGEDNLEVCSRSSGVKYLRLSCWSYNRKSDFKLLRSVFNNQILLTKSGKQAYRDEFFNIFDLNERLFSVLRPEAFFVRAERLRHHLIFYYAHTAVFYINKLVVSGYLDTTERIDPALESIMSVGVDEMSWDDILEENYVWSKMDDTDRREYLQKVRQYRDKVKRLVLKLLDESVITHPVECGSLHWIILMGMEHAKIHLETSAVIISQVPVGLLRQEHRFNMPTCFDGKSSLISGNEKLPDVCLNPVNAPRNDLVDIPGGCVRLGKDNMEQELYGWDNEFGTETKQLYAFRASQMLVSNAEYLGFVEAGGYTEEGMRWWSDEGKRYVKDLQVSMPRFWVSKTVYRSLLKEVPMPWNLPVEVNNLEAEAFCNWKSEVLRAKLRMISYEENFHMQLIAENETCNKNLNQFSSPTPVNFYCGDINGKKVYDISGNVWRHSVSVLTTIKGFKVDPYYDDFTLPTIDGFHNHVVGGSWITLGTCGNFNARFGFRRHFYQYAGIRYVESINTYHDSVPNMIYDFGVGMNATENYTNINETLLAEIQPVQNWPKLLGTKAAKVINDTMTSPKQNKKLLILNGGTGRATLEILRACNGVRVDHADTTANTLSAFQCLMESSVITWQQQLEGMITQTHTYHLVEGEVGALLERKDNSIAYWQTDACNIRPQLKDYDIVVADIRKADAKRELQHITPRLKVSGILILGILSDDIPAVLKECYERIEEVEHFAHLRTETRNKREYAVSRLSVWKKMSEASKREQTAADKKETELSYDNTYYKDTDILAAYQLFHFGEGHLLVKNFPLRMSEVCREMIEEFGCGTDSLLEAGCGPGRMAIELSQMFTKVECYDYAEGFVNMCRENMNTIHNVTIQAGDSHCQMEMYPDQKFDLIVGCNLIDRLHIPSKWLQQSKVMVKPGGLLIVTSPYTWKKGFTALENWLGGVKRDGENYFTVDGIKACLFPEMQLVKESKVPFVIRDADGTYQYSFSNCTVFKKL